LNRMSRNRDLFWQHLEPEHRRARAYCRKLTGSREDGDDLYQDALVCALTGFARLRETGSFRPWLYRIIINTYKNRVKQPWWRRVRSISKEIVESTPGDNPNGAYAARRRLAVAFRALSPEERAMVTLFELEGWTAEEVGRATGKAPGTVRVRLKRARDKMRQALIRYFDETGSGCDVSLLTSEDKVCVVHKPAKD
jgi:RNA polymerase sigma-70 factor (ECF subfamily)